MASATLLHDITSEEFMQSVRVNALSYVLRGNIITQGWLIDHVLSAFLAVKHASLAMMRANPEGGKPYGGGSIVLVASGESLFFPPRTSLLMLGFHLVAGIRSGAGPVHCERPGSPLQLMS